MYILRKSKLFINIFVLIFCGIFGGQANASEPAGHLYMQTNEAQNRIMHFARDANGKLSLIESVPTRGAGSGTFKPISGQGSAPNAFEGAGSVILAESNTMLFATNGGDNSVTSFRVSADGKLTMIDRLSTGEPVNGRSGTAKSLAYSPQSRMLYVLHAFGPNHLRSFTVAKDGKLKLRPQQSSIDTAQKVGRVATQAVLSPDGRFLLVDILFDAHPAESRRFFRPTAAFCWSISSSMLIQPPIRMGPQNWS